MNHTPYALETLDYSAKEDIELEEFGHLDPNGEKETGGPSDDDFYQIELIKSICLNNILAMSDFIKDITYCRQNNKIIMPEEDSKEQDYLEEQLNPTYEGFDTDDEELIPDKYLIKQDKEDILSELLEKLKQEQEIDYDGEEDNIIKFPEQTKEESSLEDEVRKVA